MTFIEEASAALHQAGKRMTDQRRLIINTLQRTAEQLDAEGVYHLARQADPSISIATVYRTLNVLEEAGLVQQRYHSRDHDRKHFELALHSPAAEQYHFKCRRCGADIPFSSHRIGQLARELEATLGVSIDNLCCCVDGLCSACQAEQDPPA
ncbi:MAG: transcriptional repressor [Anaerolineae bacterium]|nr:transcriptional repressor [Anaerolineae bacterium]